MPNRIRIRYLNEVGNTVDRSEHDPRFFAKVLTAEFFLSHLRSKGAVHYIFEGDHNV